MTATYTDPETGETADLTWDIDLATKPVLETSDSWQPGWRWAGKKSPSRSELDIASGF